MFISTIFRQKGVGDEMKQVKCTSCGTDIESHFVEGTDEPHFCSGKCFDEWCNKQKKELVK
jgi:endogenous inhibitor of DNA gyrase (YacG/DUF329 family)